MLLCGPKGLIDRFLSMMYNLKDRLICEYCSSIFQFKATSRVTEELDEGKFLGCGKLGNWQLLEKVSEGRKDMRYVKRM